MKSRILLVIPLLLTTAGRAAAQAGPAPPPSTPPAATVVGVDQNARETRDRLRDILGQYPPSLALVLQLDPTLLARQDYLAPYPTLASYLAQHPEVAHNPAFFVGDPRAFAGDPQRQSLQVVESIFVSATFLVGFLGFFALIGWTMRVILQHRTWRAAS